MIMSAAGSASIYKGDSRAFDVQGRWAVSWWPVDLSPKPLSSCSDTVYDTPSEHASDLEVDGILTRRVSNDCIKQLSTSPRVLGHVEDTQVQDAIGDAVLCSSTDDTRWFD